MGKFRPAYMHATIVMKIGEEKKFVGDLEAICKGKGMRRGRRHRDAFYGRKRKDAEGVEVRLVNNTGHSGSSLPRRDVSVYVSYEGTDIEIERRLALADSVVGEIQRYCGVYKESLAGASAKSGVVFERGL